MKKILTVSAIDAALALTISCSRFHNAPSDSKQTRYVVISPINNEIIWALGAQDQVVGIDLFRTRLATATREQLREEVVVLRWAGKH